MIHKSRGSDRQQSVRRGTVESWSDLRGNLRTVSSPAPTYLIDGDGRRVGKKSTTTGLLTQGFVYGLGPRPIAELNVTTGAVKSTFFYGMRQYTPDYMVDASNTVYRISSDYLGSPRVVVNVTGGANAVVEKLDYDEWGNATDSITPGSGFQPLPFGFAEGIRDLDTQIVRLSARGSESQTEPFVTGAGPQGSRDSAWP
jgi:hypothetical protein